MIKEVLMEFTNMHVQLKKQTSICKKAEFGGVAFL